jgi:hypothetical protein
MELMVVVETLPSVQEGSSSAAAADVPPSSTVEKRDPEKKEKVCLRSSRGETDGQKAVDLKEIRANHSKDKAAVR